MLAQAHADPGTHILQRRWRTTGFIKLDQLICSSSLVLQHWECISSSFIHLVRYPWIVHWLALLSYLSGTVAPANSEQTLMHAFFQNRCQSTHFCITAPAVPGQIVGPLGVICCLWQWPTTQKKRQLSNLVMYLIAWIISPGVLINYAMPC